jgi:toxin ParE1/3/4
MAEYRLTKAATEDLVNIALFGIQRFGERAARKQLDLLYRRFEAIADHPARFPPVRHIRPGYRRSVCGVHSIYYRQSAEGVEIVRVLGRQDPGALR